MLDGCTASGKLPSMDFGVAHIKWLAACVDLGKFSKFQKKKLNFFFFFFFKKFFFFFFFFEKFFSKKNEKKK